MLRYFVLVFVIFSSAGAKAETPADFSGRWIAASRDSAKSDQGDGAGHGRSSNHSMGGGHGAGGGGHHSHSSGDKPSEGASTSAATAPNDPRLHAHALIIRQSDTVFDVAADGQRMAYRFDNRNNYGSPYGGTVTLSWASPEMIIETHPDGGGMIEEHYALSDDGQHMTLRIRTEQADGSTQETRRVFDRGEGDAAASGRTLP